MGYADNGQLPNIVGFQDFWQYGTGTAQPTGAYALVGTPIKGDNEWHSSNNYITALFDFDASRCSNIYDSNATAVLPRRLQVLHCIKY